MRGNRRRQWGCGTLVILGLCAWLARDLPAQQVGRAPLEVLVLDEPTVARALGRMHLVYELHLTNFGHDTLTLEGLEVVGDDGVPVARLTQAQLAQRLALVPSGTRSPTPRPLEPGARAVAYLWLSLPPGQRAPHTLTHRFHVTTPDGADAMVITRSVDVRDNTLTIDQPVDGGPWAAVRGPSNSSPHRLSLVSMNGRVTVPERFAVDWVRLGADGLFFNGDGARVEDWYGYDSPVYAAASGTVVLVRDGAPDRQPLTVDVPSTIGATEAPGNVIVIDMGGGLYASYAHLRATTLSVAPGDHVAAGQLLAHIGNSGNSAGPHLHFQIATDAEPLSGEGRPFMLRAFTLLGQVPSVPAVLARNSWHAAAMRPSRHVEDELPLENMVVDFPGGPSGGTVP